MTRNEALERATETLDAGGRRLLDWMGDAQRSAFIVATLLVLAVAVVLDLIGGKSSTIAGHLIDLAKFVLPTVLASTAAVRYGQSRLLCCVMEHAPSGNETA